MDILKDKQYVSVPREQYEKMEKIVKDKKDIIVHIELFITQSYYGDYSRGVWVRKHVIEKNENFDHEKLGIEEMVQVACDNVTKIKDAEIQKLNGKLSKVAATWWYKLFGGSEQG